MEEKTKKAVSTKKADTKKETKKSSIKKETKIVKTDLSAKTEAKLAKAEKPLVKAKETKKVESKKTTKKTEKPKKEKKHLIKEVNSEMKKVRWPLKKEMVTYSIATLITIILFGVFFVATDLIIAGIRMLFI